MNEKTSKKIQIIILGVLVITNICLLVICLKCESWDKNPISCPPCELDCSKCGPSISNKTKTDLDSKIANLNHLLSQCKNLATQKGNALFTNELIENLYGIRLKYIEDLCYSSEESGKKGLIKIDKLESELQTVKSELQ